MKLLLLSLWLLVTACAGTGPPSPASNLPPSASDLDILGPIQLCETKTTTEHRLKGVNIAKVPWGSGEEFYFEMAHPRNQRQWLFYSDDDILVGVVFGYPGGINLKPYSVLRDTLSQLPTSQEFYLDATNLLQGSDPVTVRLYRTGDETSTTQYIVRDNSDDNYGTLLVAAVMIDPYESLLQGTQQSFLAPSEEQSGPNIATQPEATEQSEKNAFLAKQQFARGESALFNSCEGQRNQADIAVDAYSRAIKIGIQDTKRLAEAHHRLGLAYRNKGQLPEARQELEKSLEIRPLAPHVLNSLGSVLVQLDKPAEAIVPLEKAIVLQPNYARARYNLAGAYETIDRHRAIEQYETYLALVEGVPQESTRAALAKGRLEALKR